MIRSRIFPALFLAFLTLGTVRVQSQNAANYDEAKVPRFTLPEVLTCQDGTMVTTRRQWEKKRRPEVLRLISEQEYGVTPGEKVKTTYEVLATDPQALGGKATSQQVMFTFSGQGREVKALLAAYVPNNRKGRVPVFIEYNFQGNHNVLEGQDLMRSPAFTRPQHPHDPLPRWAEGGHVAPWPLEQIIDRGYALVTMCFEDIYPDYPEGEPLGVTALFPETGDAGSRWQAIGAWAWGSSRIADWVVRQPWANRKQLAIAGLSRLGKAALWAGAQDERFQVVISNESGCGGAALSKRAYGETVAFITKTFPHWFCRNFSQYANNEQAMPFDQHMLTALVAPRHLYVASAEEDNWADQKGEYLSAYYASPVYALYGLKGLSSPEMPAVNQPVMTERVAYHIRSGSHNQLPYDWSCYLDFCDKAFGRQ